MTNLDLHLPPQNLRAERAVLGSMLVSAKAAAAACAMLVARDFYWRPHQILFGVLHELAKDGQTGDVLLAENLLTQRGLLEEVGGRQGLLELFSGESMPAFCEHYAELVLEASIRRQAIEHLGQSIRDYYDEAVDVATIHNRVQEGIARLGRQEKGVLWSWMKELAPREQERIFEAVDRAETVSGLPTGIAALDRMTAGLHPGNLIIIAARTSIGKSALAFGMAARGASEGKGAVALFNLEMTSREVVHRFLSIESRVDLARLRLGDLAAEGFGGGSDLSNLARATEHLARLPIALCERSDLTPLSIRASARRLAEEGPLAAIVVDYAQRVRPDRNYAKKHDELTEVAMSMKEMARELEVPVILLSQLSREVEKRPSKRPQLSDIRESGSLESEADVVLLLYRASYYDREMTVEAAPPVEVAEMQVAKQRNGPTGTFRLGFLRHCARFENLAFEP